MGGGGVHWGSVACIPKLHIRISTSEHQQGGVLRSPWHRRCYINRLDQHPIYSKIIEIHHDARSYHELKRHLKISPVLRIHYPFEQENLSSSWRVLASRVLISVGSTGWRSLYRLLVNTTSCCNFRKKEHRILPPGICVPIGYFVASFPLVLCSGSTRVLTCTEKNPLMSHLLGLACHEGACLWLYISFSLTVGYVLSRRIETFPRSPPCFYYFWRGFLYRRWVSQFFSTEFVSVIWCDRYTLL